MSKVVVRGRFYIFDRSLGVRHREVGATISEEKARLHAKNGGDVYTLFKEDAKKLATSAFGGVPVMNPPHEQGFFSHYHPAGIHPTYVAGHRKAKGTPGHVYFGDRDDRWKTVNRTR